MKAVTQPKSQAAQSAADAQQELLWVTQLDAAQQFWHKLSRAELLQSEGLPHRLSRLLQQHYDYSREQADYQISSFKSSCS
jgi:hypothetical protein